MCWKLATHCWRRGGRWSAKLSTTGCSRRTPRLPFSLGYGCHRETKLTTINGVLLYFSYFHQQSLGKRNYRIMWEINQVKPMFAQSETGRQHQALALSGSTIFFTKKSTQSQFSYSSGPHHLKVQKKEQNFANKLFDFIQNENCICVCSVIFLEIPFFVGMLNKGFDIKYYAFKIFWIYFWTSYNICSSSVE